jgi:hypothetical protein
MESSRSGVAGSLCLLLALALTLSLVLFYHQKQSGQGPPGKGVQEQVTLSGTWHWEPPSGSTPLTLVISDVSLSPQSGSYKVSSKYFKAVANDRPSKSDVNDPLPTSDVPIKLTSTPPFAGQYVGVYLSAKGTGPTLGASWDEWYGCELQAPPCDLSSPTDKKPLRFFQLQ